MSFTVEEYLFLGIVKARTKEEALDKLKEFMSFCKDKEYLRFYQEIKEKLERVSEKEYEEQVVKAYEDYTSDDYLYADLYDDYPEVEADE